MSGYRVLLLDTKRSNPNHYICLGLAQALRQSPSVESVFKADPGDAIAVARENRCNLFFAFDGEELDPLICARLAAQCGSSVLWVTEDPYEIVVNVANAALFDLVFTNDSGSVAAYGAKGRHLPLAAATEFHWRDVLPAEAALRYDVFFAGTAWPNRVELVRDLLASCENAPLRTKIALPTNAHLPKFELPIPLSQMDWRTSPLDFARMANMSVATLVLPRVFSSSGENEFAETPPPRLFEAALAGTVQLVHSKIAEAAKYFVPGEDFLYFDDVVQLREQIDRLKAEPDYRHSVASSAQQRAARLHRYESRVATVLKELDTLRSEMAPAAPIEVAAAMVPATLPRMLLVAHNVTLRGNFGGVEVYLRQLAHELDDRYEALFWLPSVAGEPPGAVVTDAAGNLIEDYRFSQPITAWMLSCPERESAFARALVNLRIEVVHFHHLLGHVPSMIEVARAVGVPSALTFHDYYTVCHNFTLVSFKGRYCAPDTIAPEHCDVCLWNGHHVLPGSQSVRRAFWDRMLGLVDMLVFNTAGALALAGDIFPAVARHRRTHIVPVPVEDEPAPRSERSSTADTPFRVAVIGNFAGHKGSDVITRVIPLFENVGVEFHVFGRVEPRHGWMLDRERFPYVHVHGGYQPGEMPEAARDCHVSLHLSIWPETYCLTLSEAWDLGLVPIVSDIGALAERVTHDVNGLKVPVDSEGDLVQAIRRLMETPGLLHRLRQGAANAPIARMATHAEQLHALYQDMLAMAPMTLDMPVAPLADGYQPPVKPLLHRTWALVEAPPAPDLPSPPPPPSFYRRLRGLGRRAVEHFRRKGAVSAIGAAVRLIRRKL